ncbi:MAG: hypothetical protein AB7I48_02220 [Planctomycetaceae bacterium]
MREPRNPFRLRRAESIDTETAFLTLFEPGILEVIPPEGFWETVHILRSAAGGGKTSLIRLFTPNTLLTLCAKRTDDRVKELYQRVKDIGAIDDAGPSALGVMLMCGPGYSMLQDLDLDQARKDRLFFGLLNSRIVLAVLRGALVLKGFEYPDGLDRIQINPLPGGAGTGIAGLTLPCSGKVLHDWAEQREAKLCQSLDSLGPLRVDSLPGDESLLSLSLIRPENILIDQKPVAERVVLMMDDIHKLTGHQRAMLVQTVIDARNPVGVWIAERFEALSTREMLSSGAQQGRDYERAIEIESYWRQKPDRFEKLAMKVADRRVQAAPETEIDSFKSCLQDALDAPEWSDTFANISETVSKRLRERVQEQPRFQEWIAARDKEAGTPRERAIAWRALEILIERELNRKQKTLFESPLDEEDLKERDDSSVTNAAELFLAREFDLPYYYGPERVSRLASLNIQQFLGLAGEVFEESAAAELLRKTTSLHPRRQHALMKKAAKSVWEEIPKRVRHGRELRRFLEAVGKFAHWYTYRPTAPNDPGVSGTAIRMSERSMLVDDEYRKNREDICRFADILASALAHNLLVAQLDYNCKKEKWMVLNLNRLLCVHFDLPLNYGLYKERPLSTLCQWMSRPFTPPSNEDTLV